MTVKYFCTLFDSGYLIKGLAMLRSLHRHCPDAFVFVLCMDDQTRSIIKGMNFDWVLCIDLSDIENEELLKVKNDRTIAEYCWTLSPCLPWHILSNYSEVDLITYLDADLYFFSGIDAIFSEIGSNSIAIIEHRFEPRLQDRIVNGRFCVEWVSFRRDQSGLDCLSRWRDQCIDWCYYRVESNRMGDQKYLDVWPEQYAECHIIENLGAGVAPWNYSQYTFSSSLDGHITVDGVPLIFYHFHQFHIKGINSFERISSFYQDYCPVPEAVYSIYEEALLGIMCNELSAFKISRPTYFFVSPLDRFVKKITALVSYIK